MGKIIEEYSLKIKTFWQDNKREIWLSIIVILVAFSSFEIGRISVLEEKDYKNSSNLSSGLLKIPKESQTAFAKETLKAQDAKDNNLQITASKNGTRYYFSYCSGANRISAKNKIYFKSEEEAKKAGYTLASGCK